MRYHGTPDVDEEDRFERGWWTTGDSIFAVGEPAGSDVWYPVNGHPLDKATYTMAITVPEPYEVVSNGLLDSVARSTGAAGNPSTITYTWENQEPTASYLVMFHAAELDVTIGEGPGGITMIEAFPPDLPDQERDPLRPRARDGRGLRRSSSGPIPSPRSATPSSRTPRSMPRSRRRA